MPKDNSAKLLTLLTQASGIHRAGIWDGAPLVLTGISVDSRDVKPGHLFAALPGVNIHGGEFISYAIRMGAGAILTDQAGFELAIQTGGLPELPVFISEEPRRILAQSAAVWFEAQPQKMVAVTGTNGKTSVADFTRQIWEALELRAVNFGTIGVEGAIRRPLSHTTPEPLTLHKLLAELYREGVTHAAMEASSHGLAQNRLDGVTLAAAAYTHLSRDHLDYHADFEEYFEAKAGLFKRVLPEGGVAVLNSDDPYTPRLEEVARTRDHSIILVGEHLRSDIAIGRIRYESEGQRVQFMHRGISHLVTLPLIGAFQAHNLLMAAGLAIGAGAEPAEVFKVLDQVKTVRGRMELVAKRSNGATIFVDYAHTPDSVKTALEALRPHVMGRLIVVVGAGGDRDPGKRPLMGAAAQEGADVVFVTDDNPRSEDPAAIRAAVMAGATEANEIGDRAHAILAAVDALGAGDVLLIAGKGHETGQIVGGDVLPFNDAEQASIAVAALEGIEP